MSVATVRAPFWRRSVWGLVRILVVDDDFDVCRMLAKFLEHHGYTVFSAADALQGLAVLKKEQVGLVITDLDMPFMNGIAFTEKLKATEAFKHLPVILLTAHLSEEVARQGLRKGVAMTLSKPINFESLLNLVRFAS